MKVKVVLVLAGTHKAFINDLRELIGKPDNVISTSVWLKNDIRFIFMNNTERLRGYDKNSTVLFMAYGGWELRLDTKAIGHYRFITKQHIKTLLENEEIKLGADISLDYLKGISNTLCFHFKVPSVKKMIYSKRGRYYWKTGTLSVMKNYPVPSLLHEMAHHIHHTRLLAQGYTYEDRKGHRHNPNHPCAHHGTMFCEILWETVNVYYDKPFQYLWSLEYKCIQKWVIENYTGHKYVR